MQLDPLTWTLAVALLCILLVRAVRLQQFAPLAEGPASGELRLREDEEPREEHEHREPVRRPFPSLGMTVAALAAVRVALLVALRR